MENYILEKMRREKGPEQEEQNVRWEESEASHFISLRNPQLLILLSDLSSSEPNVA